MIGGEIQSVYFPDGDWSAAEPEYWARALAPARVLRPRPRILLVGLGGGTQVHLLKRYATPRLVTVIERDPIVIGVANEWFGLKSIGGLEILCADAERAIRQLMLSHRRFDFIMDDISYVAPIDEAVRAARSLARLLAPRGVLVLNQHRRPAALALGEAVSDRLPSIRLERVRKDAENVLVIAARDGTLARRASGTLKNRAGRSKRPRCKATRKRRPRLTRLYVAGRSDRANDADGPF